MRFGIGIPTCREGVFYPIPFAGPQDVAKLTQLAERMGYDSVWATDFITPTPSMGMPPGKKPSWYEPLISLAYLAAVTKHIKLGAGVILLPYRDPVILAKQAATLDQFSGGRFLFGWGLGGNREEFESIQSKNRKAHRGKMLEEHMEALHLLLNSEGKVSFTGQYYEFHDVELNPKPLQKPLPVYIGGHSTELAARIARWASGLSITVTAVTDGLREAVESLVPSLEKEGRELSEIDRTYSTYQVLAPTHEEALRVFKESYLGQRVLKRRNADGIIARSFIGTPEESAGKIAKLVEEGITHCITTNFGVNTAEEALEQVQIFGEEVLPLVKSK